MGPVKHQNKVLRLLFSRARRRPLAVLIKQGSDFSMSTTRTVNTTTRSIPIPRPSASVVIVNGKNEILLVQRNPKSRSFGGMHVFPGGNIDKQDNDSLLLTAIRETFEESGLLLASSNDTNSAANLSETELDDARFAIHQQKIPFQRFLSDHRLKADTGSLLPFTEWITPVFAPRRFHTRFFVAFLPLAPSTGFSSGVKQDRIPKPDGGQEVIAARFISPHVALAESHTGTITLMPPQYYILSTLASILKGSTNTAAQRQQVETLSRGPFGRMVINPHRLTKDDGHGRVVLTYEGDETRGGPKGRLHRALLKAGEGEISGQITLLRNFDIFSDIEERKTEAKL